MIFRTECTYQVYSEWITTQLEQVTVKASFIPARRPIGIVHSWILSYQLSSVTSDLTKESSACDRIDKFQERICITCSLSRVRIYICIGWEQTHYGRHPFNEEGLRVAKSCKPAPLEITTWSSWRFILPHTLQFFTSISSAANYIRFDDK